jgi:hypothetical protein
MLLNPLRLALIKWLPQSDSSRQGDHCALRLTDSHHIACSYFPRLHSIVLYIFADRCVLVAQLLCFESCFLARVVASSAITHICTYELLSFAPRRFRRKTTEYDKNMQFSAVPVRFYRRILPFYNIFNRSSSSLSSPS